MVTYKEIIDKIDEIRLEHDDFVYCADLDKLGFGPAPIIDEVGNREGGGSYAHVVRHFVYHDVYIKLTGFYSSYRGCDWSEYEEVKPTTKTIKVFNKVQ